MIDSNIVFGITNFHMWVTFIVTFIAIFFFASEKLPMEISTIGIVTILLLFFHFFPYYDANGNNLLDATEILRGFANPVLFAILSLLVIGQGLFQTGAVERPTQLISSLRRFGNTSVLAVTLIIAGVLSAFLNNTPVVVIFIPIISAVATRIGLAHGKALMPLSFICILGGMITLIGSSANLIAATLAHESGMAPIGFFDFTVPGILLAGLGSLYVIFVLPRILEPRASMAQKMVDESGKQFIAQVTLTADHPWVGSKSAAGLFPELTDMTVRLVQRGEHGFLPPFEDVVLQPDDVIILAATRRVLTDALTDRRSILSYVDETYGKNGSSDERAASEAAPGTQLSMAEAVVAPGSRLIGRNIEQAALRSETECIVLGIQRRSRMVRTALERIRLDAGDVLLVLGTREAIRNLRSNRDLLLLEWLTSELPVTHHAHRALLIFGLTIFAAATGLLPIVIAALLGAMAMVVSGCLNIRQATRAFDRRIFLLVGTAFALAESLRVTGGAQFIAHGVVDTFASYGPAVLLSALFLLTAILTNFLSNHATAALLAPISVGAAQEIGVSPEPFLYGLIFALNCSFATPIAYQTNLIVMGPGHYRFRDFIVGGLPLIIIIWIAYSTFAPMYYGL